METYSFYSKIENGEWKIEISPALLENRKWRIDNGNLLVRGIESISKMK